MELIYLVIAFMVGSATTFALTTPKRMRKMTKENFYRWLEQHPEVKAEYLNASLACKIAMNRPHQIILHAGSLDYGSGTLHIGAGHATLGLTPIHNICGHKLACLRASTACLLAYMRAFGHVPWFLARNLRPTAHAPQYACSCHLCQTGLACWHGRKPLNVVQFS